ANAMSAGAVIQELASIVGPALAGLLIAGFGVMPVYLFDAFSFLCVVAALISMRHRAASPKPVQVNFRAMLDGIVFAWNTPLMRSITILDFAASFFVSATLQMPVFAAQILHVGSAGVGLLFAAPSIGAAMTAVLLSSGVPIRNPGATLLGAFIVSGASIAL